MTYNTSVSNTDSTCAPVIFLYINYKLFLSLILSLPSSSSSSTSTWGFSLLAVIIFSLFFFFFLCSCALWLSGCVFSLLSPLQILFFSSFNLRGTLKTMVDLQTVCCMCGDVGFPDKLFRCNKCRHRFQHSYALFLLVDHPIPFFFFFFFFNTCSLNHTHHLLIIIFNFQNLFCLHNHLTRTTIVVLLMLAFIFMGSFI